MGESEVVPGSLTAPAPRTPQSPVTAWSSYHVPDPRCSEMLGWLLLNSLQVRLRFGRDPGRTFPPDFLSVLIPSLSYSSYRLLHPGLSHPLAPKITSARGGGGRNRSGVSPPSFQRWGWASVYRASCRFELIEHITPTKY